MSVLIFPNLNPNLTIFHDRLILHMSGNNVNFVYQNCYAVLPGNNLCPNVSRSEFHKELPQDFKSILIIWVPTIPLL